MDFSIFVPPLIGGVIGYITNDIAIKMLFHPRYPVYIGKWQLPLTPGLIPKEKDRIAKSIGDVISTQLLNPETLKDVFLSEKILYKLKRSLETVVDNNRQNTDTVEDLVLRFAPKEVAGNVFNDIKSDVTGLIHHKLVDFNIGKTVSKSFFTKFKKEKIDGKMFGILSKVITDEVINSVAESVGETVDLAISKNSAEIVDGLISTEVDKLRKMRICDIIEKYDSKIPFLIDFVMNTYQKVITDHLEQIIRGIDIAKIVEDKIASFDVAELEKMILSIMKKELNAIVWLGAILGFLMGWLNLLIKI